MCIMEADKQIGNSDPDFADELPEDDKKQNITLTNFTDVDVYNCCEMPRNYYLNVSKRGEGGIRDKHFTFGMHIFMPIA